MLKHLINNSVSKCRYVTELLFICLWFLLLNDNYPLLKIKKNIPKIWIRALYSVKSLIVMLA